MSYYVRPSIKLYRALSCDLTRDRKELTLRNHSNLMKCSSVPISTIYLDHSIRHDIENLAKLHGIFGDIYEISMNLNDNNIIIDNRFGIKAGKNYIMGFEILSRYKDYSTLVSLKNDGVYVDISSCFTRVISNTEDIELEYINIIKNNEFSIEKMYIFIEEEGLILTD